MGNDPTDRFHDPQFSRLLGAPNAGLSVFIVFMPACISAWQFGQITIKFDF